MGYKFISREFGNGECGGDSDYIYCKNQNGDIIKVKPEDYHEGNRMNIKYHPDKDEYSKAKQYYCRSKGWSDDCIVTNTHFLNRLLRAYIKAYEKWLAEVSGESFAELFDNSEKLNTLFEFEPLGDLDD